MKKVVIIQLLLFAVTLNYAQPSWIWAVNPKGISDDRANGVATDALGNAYITGQFTSDTIQFGNTTMVVNGHHVFTAKYSASGVLQWVQRSGGTYGGWGEGIDVTVDGSGNVYSAGVFEDPRIEFGSVGLNNVSAPPNQGNADIFIVKYNSTGAVQWAKSFEGIRDDRLVGCEVDAQDNIYVCARFFSDSLRFGLSTFYNPSPGSRNTLIIKIDPHGNVLWNSRVSAYNLNDFKVDGVGNSYITGKFSGKNIFGTDTLIASGDDDIFVVKYDTIGNVLWARKAGGTDEDEGYSIACSHSGDVYVCGTFRSWNFDFAGVRLSNYGFTDAFLAKYDSQGNAVWAKNFGSSSFEEAQAVICSSENIFVTGDMVNQSNFGNFNLSANQGIENSYIVRFDESGNALGGVVAQGGGRNRFTKMAANEQGDIYAAGYFDSETLYLNNISLIGTRNTRLAAIPEDILLAKVSPSIVTTGWVDLNESELFFYPNPATSTITIKINSATLQHANIYNSTGELLMANAPINNNQLSIESLANGIYFLEVKTSEGIGRKRFVKM